MSHPLRRVSTGSLSALARSQDHPPPTSSASGLDFLTSAMLDLSDEAATLSSHLTSMNKLHHELGVFNEAFAGYLYALRLNAFCVEWTEAPDEASFKRSAELTSQVSSSTTLPTAQPTHQDADSTVPGDLTYATVYSSGDTSHQANVRDEASPRRPASRGSSRGRGGGNSGIPRATTTASSRGRGGSVAGTGRSSTSSATVTPTGAAAPRPTTLAERKKRDAVIAGIIDTLPIEFRGGDPVSGFPT